MTVGSKSTFRQVSVQAGCGCAAHGTWSTPSFTCKPPAASGAHYPRTARPGNRSTTSLSAGVSAAYGMRCCASKCAPRQADGLSLSAAIIDAQSIKTVSKGGSADMTQAKESKGGKRHIASHKRNGAAAGCGGAFIRHSGQSGSQGFADQAVRAL